MYPNNSNDIHSSVNNELLLFVDGSLILVFDRDPNIIQTKLDEELMPCYKLLIDKSLSSHIGKKTECICLFPAEN